MARVLVIRFSSLGDITLTFPAVRNLVDRGDEVHFLTKDSFKSLVALGPKTKEVHGISDHAPLSELIAKVKELRALEFDHVYDLHRNLRSRIACLIIGRPVSRIWKYRLKEWFLFTLRRRLFRRLGLKSIGRATEALRVVGVAAEKRGDAVRVTPLLDQRRIDGVESARRWASELAARSYVCVTAESAWAQKQWPVERFVAVARWLAARKFEVVWLGLKSLPTAARIEGSVDFTGKLGLPDVMAVLKGAKALVSNDSGLMHIAEAAGTPVVAIFGPTSGELGFGPRLPMSRVVERELWCRPCSKTGRWCIRPIARRKCLDIVTVDQVTSAIEEVLSGRI